MDRTVTIPNGKVEPESACPVCGLRDLELLVQVRQVPVHCNLLWAERRLARQAPKGDMQLGFCRGCGHIFNLAFDPALVHYGQHYENSLHFSPRFQRYAESLAVRLIERYDLRGKNIVEIGCGRGEFLTLLCELGDNSGLGFDPSYVTASLPETELDRVKFVPDYYSEVYADYPADFICCRHVLEHIDHPTDFLTVVRGAIGQRSIDAVFFEVPNVLFTLRDLAIWDIIYEHCSYFSPGSLAYAFRSCGFHICELAETFEGQFLSIEALPGRESPDFREAGQRGLDEMSDLVAVFAGHHRGKIEAWRQALDKMACAGQRVVVWGAGSKGVTFLNMLDVRDQIQYVVDINPRKQGMYVAGSGQQIVPPDFLRGYQPDAVIVMNEIYKDEIAQMLFDLGLTAGLLCA